MATGFITLSDGRKAPAHHGQGSGGVGQVGKVRWVKTGVVDDALVATGVKFSYGGANHMSVLPPPESIFTRAEEETLIGVVQGLGLRTTRVIELERDRWRALEPGRGFTLALPMAIADANIDGPPQG